MAVKSNGKQLEGMFQNLSLAIKDQASRDAMKKINRESVKALESFSRLQNIFPSYVTGQDRMRSRQQQRQNERYGRSITNWKEATYENSDVTGAITGSPRMLGYRAWFVERGTKTHSRWGKSTGAGFQARPFYEQTRKHIQKIGEKLIAKSVAKTIKKLTR